MKCQESEKWKQLKLLDFSDQLSFENVLQEQGNVLATISDISNVELEEGEDLDDSKMIE